MTKMQSSNIFVVMNKCSPWQKILQRMASIHWNFLPSYLMEMMYIFPLKVIGGYVHSNCLMIPILHPLMKGENSSAYLRHGLLSNSFFLLFLTIVMMCGFGLTAYTLDSQKDVDADSGTLNKKREIAAIPKTTWLKLFSMQAKI